MSAKKTTILAVDDDVHLLRLIVRNLELEGYDVLTASDGREALEQIQAYVADLVLLDLMLPEMDGFTVCSAVREFSAVPIIILTARGQDRDKVRGFDLGADDYLTKPFSVEELLARVRAVLRRTQFTANEHVYGLQTTMTIGELSINDAQHLVMRAGQEVNLTPVEYRLLFHLAQNAGRIVTQDQLLEYVWGDNYVGEGHLLQVNMSRLRSKLEPDPAHPRYILTKVGIGYMLAAPAAVSTVGATGSLR
jgi:DNA-binding response OmpR family regulator